MNALAFELPEALEAREPPEARGVGRDAVRLLVGRSTIEGIQSGLYFGNRAILRQLTRDIREEAFQSEPAVVIGTGGFSRLFEREKVFDALLPDLVLIGLERALSLNEGASRSWKACSWPRRGTGALPRWRSRPTRPFRRRLWRRSWPPTDLSRGER